MDKKTLNIVLGAALLGSFFLAYFSFFGRSISGFDMATASPGNWQQYLLFLIPLSGLLLLVGALNNGNSILPGSLLSILPLLTLLYIMIAGPLIKGAAIGDIFKALGKGYGIGLWIAIAASLVLAFYRPKSS
ncbi:MAG: hypothetical protein KBF82_02035 [Chitinophagaceae bacterium]|nr:hypothetical protein [Chitinophagaceae bacterium]MBP9102616.1 hypothetical protein [Chitinophagaceae bacterium]